MILMTGIDCPSCDRVKRHLKKDIREISINTPEGMAESAYHGIGMVPALIVNDNEIIYGVNDILRRVNDE